jgi:hypothetical protein
MNELFNQNIFSDNLSNNDINVLLPKNIPYFDPNIVDTISHINSVMLITGFYHITKKAIDPAILSESYDINEDFEWFTSGQVDVSGYRSKYIAIWKKQIVGSGDTALEVERLAKAYHGESCRPSIIYIPENEDSIL